MRAWVILELEDNENRSTHIHVTAHEKRKVIEEKKVKKRLDNGGHIGGSSIERYSGVVNAIEHLTA